MGFIYYLCCCCEAIFDCLTCCFRSKEDRKPSLSDFLPDSGGNQSLRKKSELELIIVVSSPTDDEKSSPKEKPEHKKFTPRPGLITPERFDSLDKRLVKNPEDETLIQIYQKLTPAAVSEKISEELWTNGSKITNERFKSFLILSIELYKHGKISQDKLISIFMGSLGELAESGSTEKFKLLLSAIQTNFEIDQIDLILASNCLLASSESGSIAILQELMSFISKFPKGDQEYILKAYPLALKVAEKKGHTDFIKELTSYFCKIVPDDRSFFEQAKTDAIMKAKSLYDAPKNQEEILKTLESLKYEVPEKDVIIDLTTALTTTAPEMPLPPDHSEVPVLEINPSGEVDSSSIYVS